MDAQLTEEGAWRRMWGDFPALGRLLGEARVPDHELSWFDHIDRLMRISILVRENAGELRGTDPEARDAPGWDRTRCACARPPQTGLGPRTCLPATSCRGPGGRPEGAGVSPMTDHPRGNGPPVPENGR